MTDLERKVANLQKQITELAERVRVSEVAEEFLAEKVTWREGDMFVWKGEGSSDGPCRIWRIWTPEQCGKPYERWGIRSSLSQCYETERPADDRIERLYTRTEVAEILARRASRDDVKIDPVSPTLEAELRKAADIATVRVGELHAVLWEAHEICAAAGIGGPIADTLKSNPKRFDVEFLEDYLGTVVMDMRRAQGKVALEVNLQSTLSDGRGVLVAYSDFINKHLHLSKR